MHSLRARLLAWVVVPLAGAIVVDGWISLRDATTSASVVQDQLLIGSARMIAEQLRFEDGAIQDQVPPAALELFQSHDIDRVYYRVIDNVGLTVTGYPELVLPAAPLQPETPQFFDAVVRGDPVRAVAYLEPVLSDTGIRPVRVEIGQTLNGRTRLAHQLWVRAMRQQLVLLAMVALLVLLGLRSGLRPLLRLRDAVLARRPGTSAALEVDGLPIELAPLVDAVNDYAGRQESYMRAQQVFIQNAAHQLRTPLTLLNTQVSYAQREHDERARAESLAAIRTTVQHSARLVNQLLMLSAAEGGLPSGGRAQASLDAIVRQVHEDLSGLAQAKGIDLGFEADGHPVVMAAHPVMLREIAMNLVDNAIRYTQPGGVVTTRIDRVEDGVSLVVEDDGPGIPVDERVKVFDRFYRLQNRESDGCGLGLAIVREFADRANARVTLRTADGGHGLAVEVRFASAPETAPEPAPAPAFSPNS